MSEAESWPSTIAVRETGAGYQVIAANAGADALALLLREELDLVISDLCMVGMSGDEFQAEIKHLAPNLPGLIITAFTSIPGGGLAHQTLGVRLRH